MATMYDAPAEELVEAVAERLADEEEIEAPDWLRFVKTGEAKELPPEQEDFWARRAASLLRKVAEDGPVGVERLTTEYGHLKEGTTRYRVSSSRRSDGSGKLIRVALQQLEAAGYVVTAEGEGRRVSPEGQSFLDETAEQVIEDLDRVDLQRYA